MFALFVTIAIISIISLSGAVVLTCRHYENALIDAEDAIAEAIDIANREIG
jgi:hypothetical protein